MNLYSRSGGRALSPQRSACAPMRPGVIASCMQAIMRGNPASRHRTAGLVGPLKQIDNPAPWYRMSWMCVVARSRSASNRLMHLTNENLLATRQSPEGAIHYRQTLFYQILGDGDRPRPRKPL